jgi:uncharacterized protein YndB with AHSA1/START domain
LAATALRLTRIIAAPPDAVFDAWLEPDTVRQWLFVGAASLIMRATVEPRVGGRFSIVERNGDEEIDHFGEYLEIERPRRLAFTLQVPRHFPGVTRVTIDIALTAGGSAMTFTQEGVKPEVTEGNWRDMFNTLGALLSRNERARWARAVGQ